MIELAIALAIVGAVFLGIGLCSQIKYKEDTKRTFILDQTNRLRYYYLMYLKGNELDRRYVREQIETQITVKTEDVLVPRLQCFLEAVRNSQKKGGEWVYEEAIDN